MYSNRINEIIRKITSTSNPHPCYGLIYIKGYKDFEIAKTINNISPETILLGEFNFISKDSLSIKKLRSDDAFQEFKIDQTFSLEDFDKWLNCCKISLQDDYYRGKKNIIIIDNFHCASLDLQYRFIQCYRGWQQTISNLPDAKISLLICGSWNKIAFFNYWSKTAEGLTSPDPDEVDIHSIMLFTKKDLKYILKDKYHCNEEQLNRLVSIIFETTGGDYELVEKFSSKYSANCPDVTLVEQDAISFTGRAIDVIRNRSKDLTLDQIAILTGLCINQSVILNHDNTDAEELIVRGLVIDRDWDIPQERLLEFSSDTVANIMRANGIFNKINVDWNTSDTVKLACEVNEEAYRLILKIENLLRNCVVINISSKDKSFREISDELEISIGISTSKKEKKLSMSFAIDALKNRNIHKSLINPQDITFLTCNEIKDIILNKKLYSRFFKNIFDQKQKLISQLDSFCDIRNNIAHNRIVSWVVIRDLENIYTWFIEKLGRYSSTMLKEYKSKYLLIGNDSSTKS